MSGSGELFENDSYFINALKEKEPLYDGNEAVHRAIGGKTLTTVAGPMGAGKTTVSDEVLRISPDIQPVGTWTTRAGREGDPANFVTDASYADYYEAVMNGELVNFNMLGNNAYGTRPDGLIARHNIGPIMTKSIPQILVSGFDEVNVISMLAEESEYERRLRAERIDFKDFKVRVAEGDTSLDFTEANLQAEWLHPIESSAEPDGATKAARKIIDIINHNSGEFMTYPHAQKMIDGMRSALHRVARDVQ